MALHPVRITRQPAAGSRNAVHDAFVQIWQQAGRFDPERGTAEAGTVAMVRDRALDLITAAPGP